jgi:hypothetical protein
VVTTPENLLAWEDVRLYLLQDNKEKLPGKIYGKVFQVKPLGEHRHEAHLRFTSVSPKLYRYIREILPASG